MFKITLKDISGVETKIGLRKSDACINVYVGLKAVRQACTAVFFNKGENCIAAGRIFVAESIHDSFVRKMVAETRKVKLQAK